MRRCDSTTMTARPTKTAMDVFTERVGVCRDFQHLAVTLSRCQNIPARYVTGYLGDIRWPYTGRGRLQRVVRGVAGRTLVDDGRAPQRGQAGTRADGNGTRCGGCGDNDLVRQCGAAALLCGEYQEVLEDGTVVPPLAVEGTGGLVR